MEKSERKFGSIIFGICEAELYESGESAKIREVRIYYAAPRYLSEKVDQLKEFPHTDKGSSVGAPKHADSTPELRRHKNES